ncbi:hypothetical protein EIP91_007322 [Steccherinum ochraceum]|uniref:Amidase domain-containing protein n=1 Tax=Steccherinum ochraceum TaxID=92696 RepID=A0A4R0RX91_9APHY|nr:hypothetical protein EIP91_007322 [Steccherinum ochraceum]
MEVVRDALVAAGHTVVDWKPHRHHELCNTLNAIWDVGPEDFAHATASTHEPILTTMNPGPGRGSRPPQPGSANVREYLTIWEDTAQGTGTGRPVDAIISPVAPYAAPPHGLNRNSSYTAVWNALDYPTYAFPVTRVDPLQDAKKPPHAFLSVRDQKNYALYDPSTFENAPVGLQLSGRTLEDEAVIGMAELVDRTVKAYYKQAPPHPPHPPQQAGSGARSKL